MTDPLRAAPAAAPATALAAAHAHGPGKSLGPAGQAVRGARPPAPHSVPLDRLAHDPTCGPDRRPPRGLTCDTSCGTACGPACDPVDGCPSCEPPRRPSFGAALVRTLTAALAPLRWEPWNAHNDHRGYPSARCAYLADAALRLGGDRWPIDPVRLVLEGARPLPDPAAITSATVELALAPDRLSDGYGPLRDALALLEAGHLSSCLVEAGLAAGLAGHASNRGGGSGAVAEVAFRAGAATARPGRRASAVRSGGLGPRGLSADPRPLPSGVLRRVIRDSRPPAGSLAATHGGRGGPGEDRRGGLRHRLAVRGVSDVPDGLYELADGGPVLLRPGRATEWLRPAFGAGRADVDVAGMNVVWAITGDIGEAVRRRGPDGYQDTLLAAGAAAQHVCSAAAAAGLFCRPVRSFDEPAAEAAVRAGAGEDIVYMLLIGRPRALDFCYDLTDPGGYPWP